MNDKCNCYRFSPRDSLSGAVAQIADYLSKHPGWNETELRAFVDGLISSAGVETFNGRSGNVTLNKDDVNNLLVANCYFAEADETIESIDVLTLYKLGIRIVFTKYSSEIGGYTLAYGIEYYPTTDTAKAYLFSSGSGGVGAVVSVNGKTGTVILKAGDILMNNGDSVEYAVSNAKAIANAAYSPNNKPPYPVNSVNSKTGSVMLKVVDVSNGDSVDDNAYIFIDETENYPDIIAPDSNKLGGQIPSYYATAESVNSLKDDKLDKTGTAADSSKLGGKIPKVYTPHTNLADNSDFEHFVSQTTLGANHGDTPYGGDRWILERGTISGEWDYERNGYRNVTLNGKLVQVVPTPFPSVATPFVNMVSGTATISYDATKGEIIIESAGGVIKNVMLLEGDWAEKPEYVSKGYAAELAVCQKYYYFVDHYNYGYIGAGNAFSDTNAWFAVTLPTKMRCTPTVKMPAVYCDNGSEVVADVINIYVASAYANIVYCIGSVNGMFNKGNLLFRLKAQTDAYAAFYADLPRRT